MANASNAPFDWKVILNVPDGGLLEFNDEFPFLAPENGYTSSIEINMPASLGDKWRMVIEKQFYIVFGVPKKYARIKFEINVKGQNYFIDYYTNPDGSRNLEYDKSKEIEVKVK